MLECIQYNSDIMYQFKISVQEEKEDVLGKIYDGESQSVKKNI